MPVYKTKIEKTKDNKIWYFMVSYTDLLGNKKRYKSKKYATKEEATKEEAKFRLNIGEMPTDNKITFSKVYNELILKKEAEIRPTSLQKDKNYYKHIEKELGNIQINKLTLSQYQKWKDELNKKKLCTSYKNKIYKFLNELIKYAELYYNVSTNVTRLGGNFIDANEKKKEMQFYTKKEFDKFISAIDDLKWKCLFETLFYCGLRQGELQALNWKDIDLKNKTLNVNKTLTTKIKGEKYTIFPPKTKSSYRIIPLAKDLLKDLTLLKKKYSELKGFNNNWFVFGGLYPTPETTIQSHKLNYCELAKVKVIRIHDFRHSCASLLISKNADPVLVAKYLGHADVSMTLNRYSHMYKSRLDEIVNLIDEN